MPLTVGRLSAGATARLAALEMRARLAVRRSDHAIARERSWPRVLPLVSLPKSGGTWLADLLAEVPGYARRPFRDPDLCTFEHDVCDAVFESLPPGLLSVLKLHTRPRPANVELFERRGLKAVVMHRDLRDQCVSRYFHVLADPWHGHHELYRRLSKEAALSHCIDATRDEAAAWVAGWRAAIAESEALLELTYEQLSADAAGELGRVLEFWGIELSTSEHATIVERVRGRTSFNLTRRSLARGSTARRGVVGDWRNHLTPEQVARFER
jgi:hypothetical protein